MNKLLKKILPCLLVILSVFTITSCKTKQTYKYPSEFPTLNTEVGSKNFLQIGNYKVTNNTVFTRLLQSYGNDALKDLVDEKLFADVELTDKQKNEYEEFLTSTIYGTKDLSTLTEEEKQDAWDSFKVSMSSIGILTNDAYANNQLYYKNYYLLSYKRYIKTLESFKAEIAKYNEDAKKDEKDPYFNDEAYLNYFTSNYHKHYKLIVVTFDSELEAKDTMKSCDVALNKIVGDWESITSANKMSKEKLQEVFTNMYERTTGNTDAVKDYTYEDLLNLGAAASKDNNIASRVLNLSTSTLFDSYTHGPLPYDGRFYLVLMLEESNEYYNDLNNEKTVLDNEENIAKKEGTKVTKLTDSLKEKLFDDLVESNLYTSTSTYTNRLEKTMYEERQAKNIEIFAEGLETVYKTNFEATYNALSITDYEKFNATTKTSSTLVAKWDGGQITVDEMFDYLTRRYGALMGLLLIQEYYVLTSSHNNVVNFSTKKVLDQTKYDEYIKKDLTSYKEAFEKGNFESYGFPKNYGWNNFLRDYIGMEDEFDIITDYEGSLYEDTLNKFRTDMYRATINDVQLVAKTNEDDETNWFISSSLWKEEYDTGVAASQNKPELYVAWEKSTLNMSEDELDKLTLNDVYGHFVIKTSENDIITKVTVDQAVYEKYNEIYEETFSSTVSGLYVYFDKNLDGVADEKTAEEALLAKELNDLLWEEAKKEAKKDVESTIASNLNKVIRQYATSTINSKWSKFKLAGLRLSVINGSTYNKDSDVDDAIKQVVKDMWTEIVNYKDMKDSEGNQIGTTITGQTLDPGYRYLLNDKVHYVTAYEFADNHDAFYANNGFYRLAVTKATSRTSKYVDETTSSYPTVYQYDQYLLPSEDRKITISSTVSTRITTYYAPAINALTSSKIVNKLVMTNCKDLLNNLTFSSNNDLLKENLLFLIEEGIKTNSEE